jgi:hypothetical protein
MLSTREALVLLGWIMTVCSADQHKQQCRLRSAEVVDSYAHVVMCLFGSTSGYSLSRTWPADAVDGAGGPRAATWRPDWLVSKRLGRAPAVSEQTSSFCSFHLQEQQCPRCTRCPRCPVALGSPDTAGWQDIPQECQRRHVRDTPARPTSSHWYYRALFAMGAIPVERPSAQDTESETTEADVEL